MLCDRCNENEAIIHIKKIINGKVTEIHLCDICAKETKEAEINTIPFSFQDFLLGLMDLSIKEITEEQSPELRCEKCGTTYDEFRVNGKFGCSKCYEAFNKQIAILLKKIHGYNNHTGKIPSKVEKKILDERDINDLKESLKTAIANEEFEEAARLRDIIKDLERGNKHE